MTELDLNSMIVERITKLCNRRVFFIYNVSNELEASSKLQTIRVKCICYREKFLFLQNSDMSKNNPMQPEILEYQ